MDSELKCIKGTITWSEVGVKESKGELGFEIPIFVLTQVTCLLMNWKKEWFITPESYDEYLKNKPKK